MARASTSQLSVGTTPVEIGSHVGRFSLLLVNTSSQTIYIGPTSTVSTTTGFPIAPQASLQLSDAPQSVKSHSSGASLQWWAVVASGTATLGVMEVFEP